MVENRITSQQVLRVLLVLLTPSGTGFTRPSPNNDIHGQVIFPKSLLVIHGCCK